jgi:hypothetical protein
VGKGQNGAAWCDFDSTRIGWVSGEAVTCGATRTKVRSAKQKRAASLGDEHSGNGVSAGMDATKVTGSMCH